MIGASAVTQGGLPQGFAFAASCGCECMQLYVAPSRTWRTVDLSEDLVAAFEAARTRNGAMPTIAHGSLLLNLASSDYALRAKSIAHLLIEVAHAAALGIDQIVVHPGSNPDQITGMRNVASSLKEVIKESESVRVVVETTAGQGNSIGHSFEQIATILEAVQCPQRMGVCLDTCHVFAAGYDLRGLTGYEEVMSRFQSVIGMKHLYAVHVNDSERELGQRVDRHSPIIGGGRIGLETFTALVRDARLAGLPLIAEVPQGKLNTKENITLLKSLRSSPGGSGPEEAATSDAMAH